MFKLLLLTCVLVSCLADPWSRETSRPAWRPRWQGGERRGCGNRAEGWRACARANSSDSLAPHAHDCGAFFYCSGARPVCRRCPAGLHFNPELQVCDWPAQANCSLWPPPPRPGHNHTTSSPTVTDASTTISDVTVTDTVTTDSPSDSTPAETTDAPSDSTPAETTGSDTTVTATTEASTSEAVTETSDSWDTTTN